MSNCPFRPGSPKSFVAYPSGEFDLESGTFRKPRKHRSSSSHPIKMIRSIGNRIQYYCKLHPLLLFVISLSVGVSILVLLSLYERGYQMTNNYQKYDVSSSSYPLPNLQNLVMVAGHSVYTRRIRVRLLLSWHIYKRDLELLPKTIELSCCLVAERLKEMPVLAVRHRVTGKLPNQKDGLVVSYDFKEERFAHLHQAAIGVPESRFFYVGNPAISTAKVAAQKGEAIV